MSAKHYIFTPMSLRRCLEKNHDSNFYVSGLPIPNDGSWDLFRYETEHAIFAIHRTDDRNSRRIIILAQGNKILGPASEAAYWSIFSRVYRFAELSKNPPIRLPAGWREFHVRNKTTFFATDESFGYLRWLVEIDNEDDDIYFWELSRSDNLRIQDHKTEWGRYNDEICDDWGTAIEKSSQFFLQLQKLQRREETVTVNETIDLEASGHGSVTKHRTYSAWLEELTPQQEQFVLSSTNHSIKLRGAAGSGKTLTLELKALHELYRALDREAPIRILFATHSWTLADQIDSALQTLDERGNLEGIEVYPLLAIARSRLPAERGGSYFELLGEDSLSGKRLQLQMIDDTLERIIKSDWLIYKRAVSEELRSRVQTPQYSAERNSLVWDLMIEFACVLSAHGILPGINAERKYLPLQRTQWMMPLRSDGDKRFVLAIYTRYIATLKNNGFMTSDQLINDFLNYLETFTWNLLRERDGYDLIFVDELHLFTEQERLVLNFLTRSANEYPRMFMALDPRQAPYEIYTDFQFKNVAAKGESGAADVLLGSVDSVDLSTIHRFTPEILKLIQHIHRSYPALDLGEDWKMNADSLTSSAAPGVPPIMYVHKTQSQEDNAIIEHADIITQNALPNERVAIILVETTRLESMEDLVKQRSGKSSMFTLIKSRDDLEKLRYSRKSIVLSAAEFVSGIQFDYVIIGGFPSNHQGFANLGHQRRRFLSLLYLATSRAMKYIEIHANDELGGVPEILESAIRASHVLQKID